jgi:hypothetical protein
LGISTKGRSIKGRKMDSISLLMGRSKLLDSRNRYWGKMDRSFIGVRDLENTKFPLTPTPLPEKERGFDSPI